MLAMLTPPKRDRPSEKRFLLDCSPRNAVTIMNHTPLPNIEQVIESVADRPFYSKIDVMDRYYNIRMDSESEKHTTFLCYMEHYRSRLM